MDGMEKFFEGLVSTTFPWVALLVVLQGVFSISSAIRDLGLSIESLRVEWRLARLEVQAEKEGIESPVKSDREYAEGAASRGRE